MTLFTASKKSFSVAIFRRALMANMPASVQTLRISAPLKEKDKRIHHSPPVEMTHTQNCLKKKENELTCAIGTQPSQQLKSYVSFNAHGTSVDLEYVSSPLKRAEDRSVHAVKEVMALSVQLSTPVAGADGKYIFCLLPSYSFLRLDKHV